MAEARKVAAILVADIVGYSRLTGADEEGTLARLRSLRAELFNPTIEAHGGRVVKRMGDGVIVEFRSVVEATRCALEVLKGLAERNAGVSADKRIEARVGIHLGDVVEEADGDLMGDGVNVAARLQAICEPGGVFLSDDAYRQVRDKLQATFADLGEQALKNIARSVRVYALKPGGTASAPPPARKPSARTLLLSVIAGAVVVALVAAGWLGWRNFAAAPAPAPSPVATVADERLARAPRLSIVVLPFANMSGDPEQEYFADGLTDDLTTDLSHIPDSFVIAHNTALIYKGKPGDVKNIGRELGVRYALEGSVRRVGETITINAQLLSTETGAHLWADRFEGDRGKLGELQVEAVARIANALDVQLVNAEALRAMRERPTNPDATDLAMRGWAAFFAGLTPENLNKAIGYFDQALRLDPAEPRALVGKAYAQVVNLYASSELGNPKEVFHDADEVADRVLAAQPNNAWARLTKALILAVRQQYETALAEVKAAIASDRNFAPAYAEMGSIFTFMGRSEESFEPLAQALCLDPRGPARSEWEWYICDAHAHLAQWEQAVEWCEKSIASNSEYWWPRTDLAAAYGWLGRTAEAQAAASELQRLAPGFTVQKFMGLRVRTGAKWTSEFERIAEGLRKAGLAEGQASYASSTGSKWCEGVKIATIVGGFPEGEGDVFSPIVYHGFRQAEFDLGPSVSYTYAHWEPQVMLRELQRAVDAKYDGVVMSGHAGDAAAGPAIDRAFGQGTIVTTYDNPLPLSQAEHSSAGMGYAGASPYRAGLAMGDAVIKRAGLKSGDNVLVWGTKADPSQLARRTIGILDALDRSDVRVAYLENEPDLDSFGGATSRFAAVLKANPDIKAVVVYSGFLAEQLGSFAQEIGLKPGQLYLAGFDITSKGVQSIKDGYLNLVVDQQPFIQGYLSILNICLTKKYGFSGLPFDITGVFIDATNVDAVAPLVS